MRKRSFTVLDGVVAAVFVTSAALLGTTDLQGHDFKRFVQPVVFQAAGPNPASIQSTVDQYRAALGAVNNGNAPGPLAGRPAQATGFGAVFSDVDRQEDDKRNWHRERDATVIEYLDDNYDVIYRAIVPASPGDASLSFFGILFKDAKIARVKITTGNKAPGRNDTRQRDIVMMDDFLYGEPKPQD